jgi:hypothetical protein
METPGFPRLGRDLETPKLIAAGFGRGATWKPQVSPGLGAGARLGNPEMFAPGGTPKF